MYLNLCLAACAWFWRKIKILLRLGVSNVERGRIGWARIKLFFITYLCAGSEWTDSVSETRLFFLNKSVAYPFVTFLFDVLFCGVFTYRSAFKRESNLKGNQEFSFVCVCVYVHVDGQKQYKLSKKSVLYKLSIFF